MARRLELARRPAADAGADALRSLAVALAPHLRALLAAERRDEELVDVAAVVPLPRRVLYRACRAGEVAGARRIARRWLATRVAVDDWLRARGPEAVARPDDKAGDDLDELRASLARPERQTRRRTG